MREKLMAFAAVVVLLLGAWYVVHPQGFVPLFDADLQRLAMTPSEAHCAGVSFVSRGGVPAAECRATDTHSKTVNIDAVQPQFCETVREAYGLSQADCMGIMQNNRLWPTYDGNLTASWSQSNPYPGSILGAEEPTEDRSRTGDRPGLQR
jgi:hypothetical protein